MTDAALIPLPADPAALDQYADPGQFVELACERAKQWLQSAVDHGDIEQIVELKSQAEAIRTYTVQKQLGHDAELAAAEIVRRAERGIGLAIRKGQAAGQIAKKHVNVRRYLDASETGIETVTGATGMRTQELSETIYPVTDDVSDEQFEEALVEAKAEGNLSRANVVRKVKGESTRTPAKRWAQVAEMAGGGYTSRQIAAKVGMSEEHVRKECRKRGIEIPADVVVVGTRRIDPNVVMENTVQMAVDLFDVSHVINFEELDGDHLDGWVSSLSAIRTSLTTLINNLKKELTRGRE